LSEAPPVAAPIGGPDQKGNWDPKKTAQMSVVTRGG